MTYYCPLGFVFFYMTFGCKVKAGNSVSTKQPHVGVFDVLLL